jgi:probable F420-dependent oxidoreductase
VRFGIVLFTSDRSISPARAAMAAEDHGFAALYVPEHTHIPVSRESPHPATGGAEVPDDRFFRTLDPWIALATAAAATERIRLGTAVALPMEHDPIALAKTIASLDFLSAGRVVLGIGFGWNLEEMRDHGVDPSRRRTLLTEYIEAMRALWTEEKAVYSGDFVSLSESWAWPKPKQPHLPILLGAAGTERSFSWLVRHADGWITNPHQIDRAGSALRLLNRMWEDAGRAGRPEIVILGSQVNEETVSRYEDLGVAEMGIGLPDRDENEVLDHIARQESFVRQFS